MNQLEFYKYYLPALVKALTNENSWEQFSIKGPAYYLDVSEEMQREIELFLDQMAGQDEFLDNVAYYFDAKSHGFDEINGIKIEEFRVSLEDEILRRKREYGIEW